jgi:hypothetical protein
VQIEFSTLQFLANPCSTSIPSFLQRNRHTSQSLAELIKANCQRAISETGKGINHGQLSINGLHVTRINTAEHSPVFSGQKSNQQQRLPP